MTDTKADYEPTGLDRFGHLEDKIFRVVESFKAVRNENEALRAENKKLKSDLDELSKNQTDVRENLDALHQEREELRDRVEKALTLLATLETH